MTHIFISHVSPTTNNLSYAVRRFRVVSHTNFKFVLRLCNWLLGSVRIAVFNIINNKTLARTLGVPNTHTHTKKRQICPQEDCLFHCDNKMSEFKLLVYISHLSNNCNTIYVSQVHIYMRTVLHQFMQQR